MRGPTTSPPARPSRGVRIGFGEVRHTRLRPWRHAFAYRAFFLCLRMDGLAPARHRLAGVPVLGIERAGLLSFHGRDHGLGAADPMPWLRGLLADAGLDADGPIWLHTFARVLGHAFKPVSFWLCHRRDGALVAVVAEVNNTFGDRRAYLLHDAGAPLRAGAELAVAKDFHVSPFCATAGRYRFRLHGRAAGGASATASTCDAPPGGTAGGAPGSDAERSPVRWIARIDHDAADGTVLQTSLSGTVVALEQRVLWRALVGYPLFGLAVLARIHWQAFALWRHRVPFHRRPLPPAGALTRPAVGGPT